VAYLLCVFACIQGCRDEGPPPTHNYNLGTDDHPLLPVPIATQNPDVLQGRATLVPLAEPEPNEPPPDRTGESVDSATATDDNGSDDGSDNDNADTNGADADDTTGD